MSEIGLTNIGNTCYMNSILQCLSASDLFSCYLLKKQFVDDLRENIENNLMDIEIAKKKRRGTYREEDDVEILLSDIKRDFHSSITYNFYKLLKQMWKDKHVDVHKFKKSINSKLKYFANMDHHDSEEFIRQLLDAIHEEIKQDVEIKFQNLPSSYIKYNKLKRRLIEERDDRLSIVERDDRLSIVERDYRLSIVERDYRLSIVEREHEYEELIYKSIEYMKTFSESNHSIISDLFGGLYLNEIQCLTCNNKSSSFDSFFNLQITIPDSRDKIHLDDCLKHHTHREINKTIIFMGSSRVIDYSAKTIRNSRKTCSQKRNNGYFSNQRFIIGRILSSFS